MKYSKFQENIFAAAMATFSFVVNAVAGSGKTTTMVEVAKRLRSNFKSVLFLAFNKSIATELASRMQGSGADCKTLHAVGYSALFKVLGRAMKVNDRKWSTYLDENLENLCSISFVTPNGQEDGKAKREFISNAMKLLNLCRINLIKGGDLQGIQSLAYYHGMIESPTDEMDEFECVNEILYKCYELDNTCEVDFTDMITLPITDKKVNTKIAKYDVVIVDEAQDLSKAQQQVMLSCIKRGGKFIAVGDPRQAINGFAGSDANSFAELKELADGKELPLSCCYRCGKTIINAAQEIVQDIEAFEGASEGNIETVYDFNKLGTRDMILCRLSAPLVGLCLNMLASGISAKVKGTDILEGLKKMIVKSKAATIAELFAVFEKETEKLIKQAEKNGMENPSQAPSVVRYTDRVECIRIVSEGCITIEQLVSNLNQLFADEISGNCVTLSTIHKAKGLESDNVFIILPSKLPLTFDGQKEWQYTQELNLKYVAITRAKKNLFWVCLSDRDLARYKF